VKLRCRPALSLGLVGWLFIAASPPTWGVSAPWARLSCELVDLQGSAQPFQAASWLTADMNGNGRQELVALIDEHTIQVRLLNNCRWGVLHQINLGHPPIDLSYPPLLACDDLDRDGWRDLALSRIDAAEIVVEMRGQGEALWQTAFSYPDSARHGKRDTRIVPALYLPPESDSPPTILACRLAGFDRSPRAVAALHAETGQLLWQFDTGSNPYPFTFRPLVSGDGGTLGAVFAMPSPANGRTANGLDDAHAWVVALRRDGSLWWRTRIGEHFHSPLWLEMIGAGNQLVVAVQGRSARTDSVRDVLADTLWVLDTETGSPVHAIDLGGKVTGLARLGNCRFALSTKAGHLQVLEVGPQIDPCGRVAASTDPAERVVAATDLTGDGVPELLCLVTSAPSVLTFRDDRLSLLGRYEPPGGDAIATPIVVPQDPHAPAILLPQRDATLTVAASVEHRLSTGLLLALLVPPVLVGGWLHYRRRSGLPAFPGNRRESAVALDSGLAGILRNHRDALLLATELAHDHPDARRLAIVTHLHSLVWLLEAAVSEDCLRGKVRERIETMANDSLEVDLPRSEHVFHLAKLLQFDEGRIRTARISAQQLANQIRTLQAAEWHLESIKHTHPDMRKLLQVLDSDLHSIRHVALAFVSVPLEREMRSAINAVADKIERGHVDLRTEADPEMNSLTVRAFRGDLATVIEELLNNALRALENSESRRIVLQVKCHRKFVILSVQDTGCGVPAHERQRIFEAGVSTRADGGTGLHACRRILDPLGASLQLAHSAEGKGTTMELRVRLQPSPRSRCQGDDECREDNETAKPRALQSC